MSACKDAMRTSVFMLNTSEVHLRAVLKYYSIVHTHVLQALEACTWGGGGGGGHEYF